jgi:regulator of nucleoside diphosphate kinase
MPVQIRTDGSIRPPIIIDTALYDRLLSLATTGAQRWPEAASLLLREVERASLSTPEALPPDVVTIGSEVTFQDRVHGRQRTITLVFPEDADIEAGRVSVLTPIGAALLGLAKGQSIEWTSGTGQYRNIAITDVVDSRAIMATPA